VIRFYQYLDTKDCLMVVVAGRPYAISAADTLHKEVREAVVRGLPEDEVLAIINRKGDSARKAVELIAKRQQLSNRLRYEYGVIYLDDVPLHNHAANTLARLLEEGHDVTALAAFVEKQERNPNPEMIEHLYKFLEFGKIPLTPDGDFLVYKAVRTDYYDIHSGSFMNSVGSVCEMPRTAVDPNRDQTCSAGLHVCSYAYLPSFAHAQGHVMLCKVSPADVVAIPHDYNNTKMRVCRYEVVGEVTSYYKTGHDELGEGARLRSEQFEVWYSDGQDEADLYDSYYTENEASEQAAALRDKGYEAEVRVAG
jgi:hypothetical protein